MAGTASTYPRNEVLNFLRGVRCMDKACVPELLHHFKRGWDKMYPNEPWEFNENFGKKLFETHYRHLGNKKKNRMFDEMIWKGERDKWDLVTINRVYSEYDLMDTESAEYVKKLIKIRNDYVHPLTGRRSEAKLQDDLTTFHDVFSKLSLDESILDAALREDPFNVAEELTEVMIKLHQETREEFKVGLARLEAIIFDAIMLIETRDKMEQQQQLVKDRIERAELKTKIQAAKDIFVKTVGYENVRECLDDYGHVLICGSPGSGKTTMALYIIGEYMEKNYNVVFLEDVSKFKPKKHVSDFVPTLIVLDDIFGYFSLTTKELVYCQQVFKYLKTRLKCLEEKQGKKQNEENGEEDERSNSEAPFKVIMTSRTNVLEMISTKFLEYNNSLLRKSSIADLTTFTKLKDNEKAKILKQHLRRSAKPLSEDDIKTISKLEYSSLGFPHLCEMFVDSLYPQEYAVEFFKEPMKYLVDQIAEIFSTPETRDRAGVLLLMILNDGVLSLVDLQSQEGRKKTGLEAKYVKCKEIVEDIPSADKLYLAAKHENHTFLTSEGDDMKFSHPTIHDAVAFVVGDMKPLFVLENCSLQFILERTKVLEDGVSDLPSGGDFTNFVINLTSGSTTYLVKRLAREIISGNFALPLSHLCFSSESMVQLLFKELSSFDCKEKCLHSSDEKYGLGFLFWASFICMGPLCQTSFQHTTFGMQEILEGCLGCCMSGNVSSLRAMISHSEECTGEIVSQLAITTVGNILEYQEGTRPFYRSLSTAGSPGKPNLLPEIETPRMHGDNRDMLIHIAAANGFADIVEVLIDCGTKIDARGGNEMTALMYACYLGHTGLVKMLLTSGADPLLLDEEGDNSLHLACRGGSIEIIQELYKIKMDLNTRGEHDRTPLMYASYNGHEDVVRFLLENGAIAEPDLTFVQNHDNCLHLTCVKGHTNIARILLEQGRMDIEMTGEGKRTPIMFACRHGNIETAKELFSKGAEIRVVDGDNFTCLHLAAIKGHLPTAEWLVSMQAADTIDCLNARGRTPLMFALQFGQVDMVQFLLVQGANLQLTDSEHTSCLHFAVKSGVLPLVDHCIDAGQDVNSATATGLTPTMLACHMGNIELFRHLVAKGADISKGAPGGCLHAAALGGSLQMVKYLISHYPEFDINKPGYQTKTPLMVACSGGFSEIAEYLTSCGADVELKDEYQRTCLHISCRKGSTDFVEWLLELNLLDIDASDINGLTPLSYAIKSDCPDVIDALVRNGADINMKDKNGRTYLHASFWQGNAKSCAKLLDLGMNVNAPDRNNRTPLMSAVSSRLDRSEVIKKLLENGADVNQRTDKGDTCLHIAHPAQADILLDLGLDINVRGAYSQTPIMSACRYGNGSMFDFLLQRNADVHLLNSVGASCLHLASMAHTPDVHIPTELLRMGLDVNAVDNKNKTPAMYAISNMNINTLELLLSEGGSLSTYDQRGLRGSLLHFACNNENMDIDIPQLLLRKGIDVNVRDRYHQTAAMCAARKGNRNLLEFLITSGANLRVVDKHGKNCLSHAEDCGHRALAEYLHRMTYRGHRW